MGTLTDQPPRDNKEVSRKKLEIEIEEILSLANKYQIEPVLVIETKRVMELRRKNDLSVRNGDIHDEQMMGIGLLFENMNNRLSTLAHSLNFIGESLDK